MFRFFGPLSLILLVISFHKVDAQQIKPNYKLLWEISGNGLANPSYLFGTIHIQDERAFNFSDSVLIVLENCATFAMEVHPDSAIRAAFENYATQEKEIEKNKESIRKWLNPQEFDSLAKVFYERTGFELEQFEYETPWALEEMMADDYRGEKDKATFLDAYLSQLALMQGKRIIGLETYREQMESSRDADGQNSRDKLLQLLNQVEGQDTDHVMEEFLFEKLVEMYEAGDIDQIQHYYEMYAQQPEGGRYIDHMLLKRNRRMYARMLPEMHKQSTFTAVGAAHLPGEGGLIELLQNGGYHVRPVTAVFSGLAAKYKIPQKKIPWQTYTNEDYGYSLQMPQLPFNYAYEGGGAKIFLYPELGTGLVYMTTSMPQLVQGQSEQKVLSEIVERMCTAEGQHLIKSKKIRVGGWKGRDVWIENKGEGFTRSQIILRDQLVYLNMLESQHLKSLKGTQAKRFFSSLTFSDVPTRAWSEFASPEGAFKLKSPGQPEYLTKEVSITDDKAAKTTLHVFVNADLESGNTYIFRYHDMPPGHFIPNQEAYINTSTTNLLNDMGAELLFSEEKYIDGFPAKYVKFLFDGRPGIGLTCTRDNRLYLLFAIQGEKEFEEDIYAFLESFEFLPYKSAKWERFAPTDSNFITTFPGKIYIERDSNHNAFGLPKILFEKGYAAVDTNSGMNFAVYENTYSPYFSFYSEDTFYEEVLDHYPLEGHDSIIAEKDFVWQGIPAKDVTLQSKKYSFVKKLRFIPSGDKLYMLWALVGRESLYGENIDEFFEGFRLADASHHSSLLKSREEIVTKLLEDIVNSPSNERKVLNQALQHFDWKTDELPLIHDVIGHHLANVQDSATEKSFMAFLEGIAPVQDSLTIDLLLNAYTNLPATSSLKTQILNNLSEEEDVFVWKEIVRLLIKDQDNYTYPYPSVLFYGLQYEKAGLIPDLVDEMIELAKSGTYRQQAYQLLFHGLESNHINIERVESYKPQLIKHLKEGLDVGGKEKSVLDELYRSGLYELCLLWQYLEMDDEVEQIIRQLQNGYASYLHFAAVNTLISHKLAPDPNALYSLASDSYFRQDLYHYLDSLNALALFPEEYKNAQAMSESYLLNYLLEEEAWEPDTLVFVGAEETKLAGEKGVVHIYKIGYEYENEGKSSTEWYPAISGLFSGKKACKPERNINWMSWNEWEARENTEDILEEWRASMN